MVLTTASAIAYSTAGFFTRLIHLDAWTVLFWRGAFAGLFLQSGSFFRRRTDGQEARFPRFSRVDRFVGTVLNAHDGARAVPTTITCGLDEENYANNAELAQALAGQGYPVDFHAARGGHDWPMWRRAIDAHLAPLLRRVWR